MGKEAAATGHSDLNVEVVLLVLLVAGQFGLVGLLVGLQVLPMLSDVGPRPHAADTLDVDLHDAVERVLPPAGGNAPQTFRYCHVKSLYRNT